VTDLIAELVGGGHPDPDGGPALDVKLRSVAIETSLDGREVELVRDLDLGDALAVVSDVDTHAALGARVERALASGFRVQSVVLPERPHADDATVATLRDELDPGTDALVAVGSGTINDLCKYVAAGLDRPYVVFATAPSMNGYSSMTASITVDSLKSSLPARPPAGAFFDIDVSANAPSRLITAGLGESMCRATSQVDWMLAHLLFGTPYREAPFALLADDEAALLAQVDGLGARDHEAVRTLLRTLLLSGFGMTICASSAPASQGEHLLAHYVGMMRHDLRNATFHGEQVAVTTLAMTDLQRRILDMPALPPLQPTTITRQDVLDHFGLEACWRNFEPKRLSPERADELNDKLAADWEAMRTRLTAVAHAPDALRAVLARANAPTSAAALGWPDALFRDAASHARLIRDRFTFLDLAAELGIPVLAD